MELNDGEFHARLSTLLAPLQTYSEPAALRNMQLCLHYFLTNAQALYSHHLPALKRLGGVSEGWNFIGTHERIALRYRCWQCLREIEAQCTRLVPWGQLVSTTLTAMLEQLESLPEQQSKIQAASASHGITHERARHDLIALFQPWLEMYHRQPPFLSTLGQSGLSPHTLRKLDTGFLSLLLCVLTLLDEGLPAISVALSQSKHQQSMAILNLLQKNDFLVKQTLGLVRELNGLRSQHAPTTGNSQGYVK
ncbi:hypothetical protein [Ktedonospora formicarum]|uniref:Uncharacterized protein n=1 Tax=Ktedonospora formicarum TaxID=2778364 RepID=A0A8J3HW14_9CHLR|nr:hypothetical protein [Ktedonospora formicarum]GHO44804.1 hypothetical protein KSX_29670 [Ktedonospora formicarum]